MPDKAVWKELFRDSNVECSPKQDRNYHLSVWEVEDLRGFLHRVRIRVNQDSYERQRKAICERYGASEGWVEITYLLAVPDSVKEAEDRLKAHCELVEGWVLPTYPRISR